MADSTVDTDGTTDALVSYSRSTGFDQLPGEVVDQTKKVVLDTLGCIILGSTMEPGQIMAAHVGAMEGVEQAVVVGAGFSAPAPLAALANGTSGHADELDASHISWGHPAVSSVAAPLAVCEARGLGGQDYLNAVVLAHDIGCKMLTAFGGRQAVMDTRHSHSSVLNALGVAAASGRLIGLEALPFKHAFALAATQIYVLAAFMDERNHMSKAMNHGQAGYAGISGALLAERGFEAHDDIFEAKHGIIDFWSTPNADLSKLTAGLGSDYSVMGTGFKYYSAGYPIHAPLWGALEIIQQHSLRVDDIETIRIGMTTQSAEIVDSRDNASICIQDMLSVGVALGRLDYEDAHDASHLERDDVKRLRDRVVIVRDPQMDQENPESRAAWVEISLSDGATHRAPTQFPPGHWTRGGMPWEDCRRKFASLAERRLGTSTSSRIIEVVEDLDSASDLTALTELLRGPSS